MQWYAVAVLLIPLTEILVAVTLGSPNALNAFSLSALMFYPGAYAAHFFFGPLFEESVWRGFALPRMQHRFGSLLGALLLGLLWSAWHFFLYAPSWFQSGDIGDGLQAAFFFTVLTTSMAFIFTWLFNSAQASLLLSILLHGSVDGTVPYIQVLADKGIISADATNINGMGLLITVEGYGHTALLNPSQYAKDYVTAYFTTGTLPPENTVCQQDQPPFAPGSTP